MDKLMGFAEQAMQGQGGGQQQQQGGYGQQQGGYGQQQGGYGQQQQGGQGGGFDPNQAAQYAQNDGHDPNMVQQAIQHAQNQNQGQGQQEFDHQQLQQTHQAANNPGAGPMDSNAIGTGAALNALKGLMGGGGGGGSAGGLGALSGLMGGGGGGAGQSALVGMAISQAANLYKQHQQAGTAQGSQQDAMNSAASMAMKFVGGGGGGGMGAGQMMSLAKMLM